MRSWTGFAAGALLITVLGARAAFAQPQWSGYAGNAQHTAVSPVASQSLTQIVWQTPVDLNPQYSGSSLLIHYGSPVITDANTVIVPVKTGASDGFRLDAHNGADGSLLWQFNTDYSAPSASWLPSYGPALAPSGRLYLAGAGGTLFYRDNVDSASLVTPPTRVAFYGDSNYASDPGGFGGVKVCTPLTTDSAGNVYFGYRTTGSNPLNLTSGIARIGADGSTTYISTAAATGGLASQTLMNCAPALSNDGKTVYIAASNGGFSGGYLLALNSTTLATTGQVKLVDPQTGSDAILPDIGTASPTVGADGRVYFGVLESPFRSSKGWLLNFNASLTQSGAPGAFGWDDTASVVPASMVPSYHGSSSYLLMTKYNNYAGLSGDGVNKLAILDPNDTQIDPRTGTLVMKEVLTIAGVTPDDEYTSSHPDAVREWCINTGAIDPATNSVLVNSEDGSLYRWDLTSNSFTQSIDLTSGIGEAYTPTLIGRDGKVYAINNATLFAVGATVIPEPATVALFVAGGALLMVARTRKRRADSAR